MEPIENQIRKVPISELLPDPGNARKQTERSAWMQTESFHKFGAARSIVIDEEGTILAGNGATQAAADQGIQDVIIVPTDGKTLVAVQRTDMNNGMKKAYAIADNRTSDLSEWDHLRLAELNLDSEVNLDDWFRPDELEKLMTPMELLEEENQFEGGGGSMRCPNCGHEWTPGDKK